MNSTKIDWADMTFNPVTGCLHGCTYCYARKIAHRFRDKENDKYYPFYSKTCTHDIAMKPKTPYPYDFAPTFHRYRLGEPKRKTKPQTIFVGSMTDLFGDFIPEEWRKCVFAACEDAPQHRYLFLTKNANNIPMSSYTYNGKFNRHNKNFWFGVSATNQKDLETVYKKITNINGNTFLSLEPLHGPINLAKIDTGHVIYDAIKNMGYYLGGGQKVGGVNWIIVGAESGHRKGKITPQREWVTSLAEQCRNAKIPLFMKGSLKELMGDDFIQQYPWSREE